MKRSLTLVALAVIAGSLTSCSGSGSTVGSLPRNQDFGQVSAQLLGTVNPPVTSSAAFGANVTGISGAVVSLLTINNHSTPTLLESKIAFNSERDGNSEIYTMNPDGTGTVRLTNNPATDFMPAWSPDGSKLGFVTDRDGNWEVYTMNADGSSPVRLTTDAGSDYMPAWSPDGTKIAFATTRDGNWEVYTMNADGTNQVRLTTDPGLDYQPAWSPDGSKIAFATTRDGNWEVYTMKSDGSGLRRLTTGPSLDYRPSWSPNGTRIAFESDRDGNWEIYTINVDGSDPLRLTNDPSLDGDACWSPDGAKLAFTTDRQGNNEIYSMNPDGSGLTRLTVEAATDNEQAWSPFLPRTPKTLVGPGAPFGSAAAGFLFGEKGQLLTSVVTFDTLTPASRPEAKVTTSSAPYNDQGTNLIFTVATNAGLYSVRFAKVGVDGSLGPVVSPTVPSGSSNALVTFDAALGTVVAVIPYTANRSKVSLSGSQATYSAAFTAVFDSEGKNLAPQGAGSVTIDTKTGALVSFR